jgi:dsRNA-specific ribonuclease
VEAPANTKPVSAMDSLKAMQEIAAKRLAEAAQPGVDMEAEGGRVIPKLLSDAYEAISATPLSRQNMEHAHDGQLDKVLASLAKTGSTPAVRELAAKLQALTKNTKLVVEADADTRVAASYSPKADSISIHPLALTEENLLHEAVHAATLRTLALPDSQLTREQRNARNELKRLFAQLQKDPAFAKEYALEDVGELASEVMTNRGLRDKIAAKQPGIIRRFVNAVLQLLGVQHKPADARAMAAVEKLFMPAKEFTRDERLMLAHAMGYAGKAAPVASRVDALNNWSVIARWWTPMASRWWCITERTRT